MKRKLILLIIISLTIITGCNQKNNSNNIDNSNSNNQTNEENKDWGVPDTFAVFANNKIAGFIINFPTSTGIPKGSGLVAYDDVGSLIIVDADISEYNITNVDDVLPTLLNKQK